MKLDNEVLKSQKSGTGYPETETHKKPHSSRHLIVIKKGWGRTKFIIPRRNNVIKETATKVNPNTKHASLVNIPKLVPDTMWYKSLTLSRRRPLSYRNQSIDLLRKSMDWFLLITASVLKGLIEMEIQWKSLVEKVQWKSSLLSNLFLVRIRDRGYCPVINLKELNQNIPRQHFKMEGLHYLKFMLRQGDYTWKPDLHEHLLFNSIEWKLQENGTLSMVREFAWVSLLLLWQSYF